MQSGLERRKEADQLNASLQLSKTLRDFLTLTEQSELPIMQSTMLLNRMEETIKAIESNLISISTEIENLSPNPENDNGGLSGAARDHQKPAITYRFIENQNAFRLSPSAAGRDRQGDKQHFDRSEANPSPNPISSKTSDREPSGVRTDRDPVTITVAESQVRGIGSYSGWSADAFNEFIYNLSVQYKPKDNQAQKEMIQQNSQKIQSQINILNNQRR
jgi:hypothetical protein